MIAALETPYWWEILRITLGKTVARSQQVLADLAAAKAALAAAPIEPDEPEVTSAADKQLPAGPPPQDLHDDDPFNALS